MAENTFFRHTMLFLSLVSRTIRKLGYQLNFMLHVELFVVRTMSGQPTAFPDRQFHRISKLFPDCVLCVQAEVKKLVT